ncbi:MAG TPA: RIO1 family regulatory kinase/ATPase [Sedimentibacter sp.]|jgi:tRNA A-37 threonylcarbamoyl transferase component Bud32|nr:RIO1 family regulatory kinase/ATPase [Sedimentibacter sp.]
MHKEIKLRSKRNNVFRIVEDEGTYILKKFENHENYIREKEVLSILKKAGVNVPSIIKAEENYLYLEDLGEVNFLEWYEEQEKNNALNISMVYELCSWFKDFYSAVFEFYKKQFILYDVNFKNFIICDNKVYGIDFEQVKPGHIEEDAGRLSAFALTYNPSMTEWKMDFRNILINILSNELNIEKEKIISEENKELAAIKKRRGAFS